MYVGIIMPHAKKKGGQTQAIVLSCFSSSLNASKVVSDLVSRLAAQMFSEDNSSELLGFMVVGKLQCQ